MKRVEFPPRPCSNCPVGAQQTPGRNWEERRSPITQHLAIPTETRAALFFIHVWEGVPQGATQGPLFLFVIFEVEITNETQDLSLRIYVFHTYNKIRTQVRELFIFLPIREIEKKWMIYGSCAEIFMHICTSIDTPFTIVHSVFLKLPIHCQWKLNWLFELCKYVGLPFSQSTRILHNFLISEVAKH